MNRQKILVIGSNAEITNLPVKEVSLLSQGSLPAYGYDPGDFIELLAGKVTVEEGRLDQGLTWLSSFLTASGICPKINTITYGEKKQIFQIFKNRDGNPSENTHGWFMIHQILPPGGRDLKPHIIDINDSNREIFQDNNGIIIIDDSGHPPSIHRELSVYNPKAWVLGLGLSVAHWDKWAREFGERFVLFARLSDLEITRMEVDSAVLWETTVAMVIRALKSSEVGLWDEHKKKFLCHIIVEMFPGGILYVGPDAILFRHKEGSLPHKGSSRKKGSVPCYDTLILAMFAMDCIRIDNIPLNTSYFFDLSKRALLNWQLLYEKGYYFTDSLEFPNLDFSSTYPTGTPCSFLPVYDDPCFFSLPTVGGELDKIIDIISTQKWGEERKKAIRDIFNSNTLSSNCVLPPGVTIDKNLNYMGVILSVLKYLKEEVNKKEGFKYLRLFQIGALRTTDPVEIEPVVTLQGVMDSYVSKETYKRPLCIGVFGPPGSGKSFAVEQVASVISKKFDTNPFEFFQFNLTQFSGPEEINSAIDLVRASVAKGKIPITFWDEFDCRYDGYEFGYLRYFLPSMQDGVTYIHGIPRHIGRAIFVFAGGVKSSWDEMMELITSSDEDTLSLMKTLKVPDFMSRLRVVLDIEGISIPEHLLRDSCNNEELEELRRILLKRAFIIAHQMNTHWKKAARKTSGLLLRLLIAEYKFGARSIEAVIEASHAADRVVYGLPELVALPAARIHAVWRVELEKRLDQLRKDIGLRGVW